MTRQSTVDTLKAMQFSVMAEEFERQLADSESYAQRSFEDRIGPSGGCGVEPQTGKQIQARGQCRPLFCARRDG